MVVKEDVDALVLMVVQVLVLVHVLEPAREGVLALALRVALVDAAAMVPLM